MTYVMSDLHGDYNSFCRMLKIIKFSKDDKLYIAGDIGDRGKHSDKLYLDVMSRDNVVCIKGNHELMAEKVLPYLYGFRKILSQQYFDGNYLQWMDNGGDATLESFMKLSEEDKRRIVEYIENMPLYATVKTDTKEFLLVHAGINGYDPNKSMDSYTPHDLVWTRPNYDATLWGDKNKFLVVGHTPTLFIFPDGRPRIYYGKGNIINIDCGNAYKCFGGMLGCVCLDTLEEYYVWS